MLFNEQEIEPFKRNKVIYGDNSEPNYKSYYFKLKGDTLKNFLDDPERTSKLPESNEFAALEYRKYEDEKTETNYTIFTKRPDDFLYSDPYLTQSLEKLNRDKKLISVLEKKAEDYEKILESNSNIMDIRIKQGYEALQEIRGEQYFTKNYGKKFDECEEYIKDDEVLSLFNEIRKNYKENGELTAEGYEASGNEKKEKNVSAYNLMEIKKAIDVYNYYDLALKFIYPKRSDIKDMINNGYSSFDAITKGYDIEEEQEIRIVENHHLTETREKLAEQYTLQNNTRVLKEGEDILTKNTEFEGCIIPSIPQNLFRLKDKGMLLPIRVHPLDKKTGQIEAVRGFLSDIEKKEAFEIDDWKCSAFIDNIGKTIGSTFTIDRNKNYSWEDVSQNKKTNDITEIINEVRNTAKADAEKPSATNKEKRIYEYLNSIYEKSKENTLMNQKNYSYIVKDGAEFEFFADFEPIKDLTAKQAAETFKKLYNEGKNPGITLKIPGDKIFGEWSELGISIAVLDPDNRVNFDLMGDTFINQLKESDERSRTYINAYKELYEEVEKSGIPVKKPDFLFEKEKELFSGNTIEDQSDKFIETMQANAGMSEAAMEKELEAMEKELEAEPFFDENEEYEDGQIPLEVVDKAEMLYFNSDKVAVNQYIIRIDEGLFNELVPDRYSKTSFNENEIPAITYRQSTDPEVPDQFLISKFNRENYDFPLIQTTIQISNAELLTQLKGATEDYERIKSNENNFIPDNDVIEKYLDEISDPKFFDEEMNKWWDENIASKKENDRQMTAEKDKSIIIEKFDAGQILQKLPESFAKDLLNDEKKMHSQIITVYNTEENPFDFIAVEKLDNYDKWNTHLFTFDDKHDIQSTMNTGHYDFESFEEAEKDALSRVLNQTNISTLFGRNTDYNTENTEILLKDNSEYAVKNLSKKEIYAVAYAEKVMPELRQEFIDEYKKEYPMLKNEKPSIDFIAKTIEKHPELIDTTKDYCQQHVDLIRKNDQDLNIYEKYTKFYIEQSYDLYESNNNKEIIQHIYEKKIESLKDQENELAKKNAELEKKEKELKKREKNIAKEEKTISEKFKSLQTFTENFDKCMNKEGEFKQINNLTKIFEGLSQDQKNNIWKTVEAEANKMRSENQLKQNMQQNNTTNKETKSDENKGTHR